ncbi:MAG: hypothetical protein Roseis2KO_46410 [Roseivirga sp.]
MKKKSLLAGLTIVALLTTTLFFALPGLSKAQEVEGPKTIEKRYKSIDDNANFYCHCKTKGTKCGCIAR